MKNSILLPAAILSTIVAVAPAHAARTNTQQSLLEGGTFVGVTIAATAAAGPVGLLVGSVAAAFLAKQTKNSNEREIMLQQTAIDQQNLESTIAQQGSQISNLEEKIVQKLSFQILFASGDDTLSQLDLQRVNFLANYLANNPDLTVALDGHTDPRGTDEYNNVLSQERAKAIKTALIKLGINEERITSTGHGSSLSEAPKGDQEAYQQERRVDIEMKMVNDNQTVAKN